MKNTITKFLSVTFVGMLMLLSNVFASTTEETMFLDSTNVERNATRSCDYSYVSVNLLATYPTEGTDNLTYIKSYIYRADRRQISDTTMVYEGRGNQMIRIYEGYLSLPYVYLIFQKGTSKDCYAHLIYNPN